MEKEQAQAQEVVTAPEDNTTTDNNATSKDNMTTDNNATSKDNTTTDDNTTSKDNMTTDNNATSKDNTTTDDNTTSKDNMTIDDNATSKDNTTTDDNATSKDNTTSDNIRVPKNNTDPNGNNLIDATSTQAIESYLTSALKNLRKENKRLAEQYRELQKSYDLKMLDKLKNLNKINLKTRSNIIPFLKRIQVRQLTVLHQMRWMIDNETQIARAYDKHCKTAIDIAEKQHDVEKAQGYDEFTNMSSDQLAEVIKSCKEKIYLNEAEAKRLTLQMEAEEEQHKAELITLRNSINSVEVVLRETSEICQELQFEKTLRDQGNIPI
ncbi:uncharacterized protein Dwil_GK15417 [Drosophila willistoni]|uniref:Uncharacterized protein n=1 Tax=Drosophila willistoni TaxID=7260 RepID=A0A0Q9X6V8_DROWI|nr:probable elastin-binding protein EbpS [Drosophila willistoni]KRG00375.1 uncharacterized protein Dwil_GK15417 [Drosophila willistoni]